MKLQFIGTGAADFDWSRYGEKNISGSCATLIDDHILIDCGTTTAKALERFNIDTDKITTVVITHNHSDHFDPAVLEKVAKGRKLRLCGSTEVCQKVQHLCETFPLHYGEKFSAGEYEFTALPANHPVEDPNEETFIYIVKHRQKQLLYALDTANITGAALNLTAECSFDAIVWDATCANDANLWMDFYHSNPVVFRKIRKYFTVSGKMKNSCKVIFSHRARQFWPAEPEKVAAIAEKEDAFIPFDGEILEI